MFFHSCLFILLNIYKGSQAEIKVLQIERELKIATAFLARQSGTNQGHCEDAREERRAADDLLCRFWSSLSVINKLERLAAWGTTQMLLDSCCFR